MTQLGKEVRPKVLPSDRLRQQTYTSILPKDGSQCLFTVGPSRQNDVWKEAIYHVLGFSLQSWAQHIFDWNDDPERTWDEVIAKAEEAEQYLGWRT